MVCLGWEIDPLVAICMIMVVGLCVDFSTHLMHAYNESHAVTRFAKTRMALTEMGISVFGGAFTTFGAGMFLFFGEMSFFRNFGFFMAITIFLSCVSSIIVLMAFLMTCGPEGKRNIEKKELLFGDIGCLMNCSACKKK